MNDTPGLTQFDAIFLVKKSRQIVALASNGGPMNDIGNTRMNAMNSNRTRESHVEFTYRIINCTSAVSVHP